MNDNVGYLLCTFQGRLCFLQVVCFNIQKAQLSTCRSYTIHVMFNFSGTAVCVQDRNEMMKQTFVLICKVSKTDPKSLS